MNGAELQIDFLRWLHGISASEVIDNKVLVKDRGKGPFRNPPSLHAREPSF
jgi:hypothetical protein